MRPEVGVILIIDDEQAHIDSLRRGLRLYGRQAVGVTTVADAQEAIARRDGAWVDLVVTDLSIAGGSGGKLMDWLLSHHPELPVVGIAGLATCPTEQKLHQRGVPVLQKPLSAERLEQIIRERQPLSGTQRLQRRVA